MKAKKELNIQIGNEIRNAREKAGLTQEQFGAMVSLDAKNVSDIERGVTGIKVATLKRICEKLLVSGDILLFGDNQNRNNVDYLAEKLARLSPEKFAVLEEMINKVFELFAVWEDE